MSDIFGFDAFLGAGTTGYFYGGYTGAGWPGVILIEAQPLNEFARVNTVPQGVWFDLPSNTYYLNVAVTNYGPAPTALYLQIASE